MGPAQNLSSRIAGWPGGLFATLDGARVDDLRGRLSEAGLDAQSLFLERPGRPAPVSGPYFLALDAARAERLLALPGIERACVLWNGPVQPVLAFRHLRSLNTARIPPDNEQVLFRHWDPAVLAMMVPLLGPEQLGRLFGPFTQVALYSADAGRVLWMSRPTSGASAPRGVLKLSPAQLTQTEAALTARSHREIARYLRRNAAGQAAGMDDAALAAFVAQAEREAYGWGVRTQAGCGRFAWLLLTTQGRLRQMPQARAYLLEGGAPSDARLTRLMHAMAHRLRRSA